MAILCNCETFPAGCIQERAFKHFSGDYVRLGVRKENYQTGQLPSLQYSGKTYFEGEPRCIKNRILQKNQ